MSKSLKIAHRGSNNTRVELPDQTTKVVPNEQLPLWELVHLMANDTLPAPKDNTPKPDSVIVAEKKYIRIRRTGKYNVCLILPDHTHIKVSIKDLPNWEQVEDPNPVKEGIMDSIEKKYLRVTRHGKFNVGVELPDHTKIKVPLDDFPNWEQIVEESNSPKQYLRVRRHGKFNVGVELPNHSFIKIPVDDFPNWECVGESSDMEENVQTLMEEKKYLRIKHHGKNNCRVELPNHSFILIPTNELSEWEQIEDPDVVPVEKKFLRVVRSCKNQVRIELPDHSTILIPKSELSEWTELNTLPFPKAENMNKEIEDIFESSSESEENSTPDSVENKDVPSPEPEKDISETSSVSDDIVMDPILGLSVIKEKKTKIDEVSEIEDTISNTEIVNIDSLITDTENKTEESVSASHSDSAVGDSVSTIEAPKKKRGRPRKNPVSTVDLIEGGCSDDVVESDSADDVVVTDMSVEEAPKKKRGRPRKNPVSVNENTDAIEESTLDVITESENKVEESVSVKDSICIDDVVESDYADESVGESVSTIEAPKKKRGRPRKNPVEATVEKKKRVYTQRNTNGLGTDHPYESVNMECETVGYDKGIEAPF